MTVFALNQAVLANAANDIGVSGHSSLLLNNAQNAGQQLPAPIVIAAGVGTRVERRHDAVDNTADRVDDKQDFLKSAGTVSVMDRTVVPTTGRTSVRIPSTGRKIESMTDKIGVRDLFSMQTTARRFRNNSI